MSFYTSNRLIILCLEFLDAWLLLLLLLLIGPNSNQEHELVCSFVIHLEWKATYYLTWTLSHFSFLEMLFSMNTFFLFIPSHHLTLCLMLFQTLFFPSQVLLISYPNLISTLILNLFLNLIPNLIILHLILLFLIQFLWEDLLELVNHLLIYMIFTTI